MTKLKSLATTLTGLSLYAVACTATAAAWHQMGGPADATVTASSPVGVSVKITEHAPRTAVKKNSLLFLAAACTDTATDASFVGLMAPGNAGARVVMNGPGGHQLIGEWKMATNWAMDNNVAHMTRAIPMGAGLCTPGLYVVAAEDQPELVPGVYSATIQGEFLSD